LIKILAPYGVLSSEVLDNYLCVNDLSRVAARQRGGWESNPWPIYWMQHLTTTLPSHNENHAQLDVISDRNRNPSKTLHLKT